MSMKLSFVHDFLNDLAGAASGAVTVRPRRKAAAGPAEAAWPRPHGERPARQTSNTRTVTDAGWPVDSSLTVANVVNSEHSPTEAGYSP